MSDEFSEAAAQPAISVVIPSFNRPRELQLCLDGFTRQTISREQFEVVVIDDGSTDDIRAVAATFAHALDLEFICTAHAGPARARNVGLARAAAPLILLYDDDQRPFPDLIEYCLNFHHLHPCEAEASLLFFELDPAISESGFACWAFRQLYTFPSSACVSGWERFWSGSITCKKSLFRHGLFDPAYQMLEDADLGLRLSRSLNLRVHFEPKVTGTFVRRPTFEQIWRRQYMLGYFSHVLARQYREAVDFSCPPYFAPEKYIIKDAGKLAAVHAIAAADHPDSGDSTMRHVFRLASASWSTIDLHVRAQGWVDAREGRPASPPGSKANPNNSAAG
jgi:glycosyltransferase involved in cell wall biosynthesis